ncbi:hypothetical protein MMC24_000985 [Lignoscripta atroalba]|nr:hypothetical protein [Lignoscripta atroalba]
MAINIKRTQTAHVTEPSFHGGVRTARWEVPENSTSFREITRIDPAFGRGKPLGSNPLIPPYHWHWYQDEYFTIKQGKFIFTLEGQELKRSAADGVIRIPHRARHTFRADPDGEEEAIIEFTASPEDSGLSERFFRNLYSYLDDCEKTKTAPSLPQLLLFLDAAEVSLAFPGPKFIAHPASWLFGMVLGRYVGWALGYKASYDEYYDPKMAKKA